MLDVPFRSANQLAGLIRRKKVGCLELLNHYLERVERYNPAPERDHRRPIFRRARSGRELADKALAKERSPGGRSTACR